MKTNLLITVLLAGLALTAVLGQLKTAPGMDFYQYWAVAQAQRWSERPLKSPYVEAAQYSAVINQYADQSSDPRLKQVNQWRRNLELFQTPLCFWLFASMPADYSVAFRLFQILQVTAFCAALILLGRACHEALPALLSLAFLLLYSDQPLLSDLNVGNLNSMQFFVLVGLTRFADVRARADRISLGAGICFMCSLVFLTLMKPNLFLVSLFLAGHLWVRQGFKSFTIATLAAMALGLGLSVLPCLRFDSWTIWQDWYHYVNLGVERVQLLHSGAKANHAAVLLISRALGTSVRGATVLVAVALAASTLGALRAAVSRNEAVLPGMRRVALDSLRDPYLIAAAGLTAALLLLPLVWFHYYTLALLPALWLLWGRQSFAALTGGLSILLTSGIMAGVFSKVFGWQIYYPYYLIPGLVCLWAGVLGVIASNAGMNSQP